MIKSTIEPQKRSGTFKAPRRPGFRRLSAPLFFVLAILSCASTAGALPPTFSARVIIESDIIASADLLTLGDIAKISDALPGVGIRLSSIPLGYSPAVGAIREISRERVLLAMDAAGFSRADLFVKCPAVIRIKRSSQPVDPQLVKEAVEKATLSELQASGAVSRLVSLDLPPSIEVPSGAVTIRASSDQRRNLFAPFMVSIEFAVDGNVVRRISATAKVEAFATVLVAERDMPAGSPVREPDVRFEVSRLEWPLSAYLTDKKRLRGVSARLPLLHGQPLINTSLTSDIVVKSGDVVRIIGGDKSLQVSVTGEARASGRVGERIQVKNTQSGVLLQAVIEDQGLVRVLF